ncbi:MAG: hypothetical protein BalsKO_29000 [Balneolaceae bacterium]
MIKIEGESIEEILNWSEQEFDQLVLIDKPIVVKIGSGEVLGQFTIREKTLVIELAQIDGGGEGVLPTINKIAKHISITKSIRSIEYIVNAINCAKPNLKLRAFLERMEFEIKDIPNKGEAYYKKIEL